MFAGHFESDYGKMFIYRRKVRLSDFEDAASKEELPLPQ